MALLLKLFISFFKIGAFSFGGGYAMLPLIEEEIIEIHGWLTSAEFIDIVAIAEMTPGSIAVNSATFLGFKVASVPGAMVATFAVVLPSFIIMSLIFHFVERFKKSPYIDWIFTGIRPVVLGLIASAAVSVGRNAFVDIKSVFLAMGLFYAVAIKNLNPIIGLIICGILGVILY